MAISLLERHWSPWISPILIVLVTLLVFFPSLRNDFVYWDDDGMFLENPHYRGLSWENLQWMFTTFHMGHYHPLTWVSLSMDYMVWGMAPFGYHLTSLLLHIASAIVFYFVILELLQAATPYSSEEKRTIGLNLCACLSSLLFAIHPLRVESVAWATERRDVLSGLFFLVSILAYLRRPTRAMKMPQCRLSEPAMVVSLATFGLALLSKAITVSLPAILLALDVFPLRRLGYGAGSWFGRSSRHVWFEKTPFFLLSIPFSIVAIVAQAHARAAASFDQYGVAGRIFQSFYGLFFYLWKTVIPSRLSPLYQFKPSLDPPELLLVIGSLVGASLTLAVILFRHRWPLGFVVWTCYVASLLPVLGFFQSGPQIVADRYSYLSCLGFAVLPGAGMLSLWRSAASRRTSRKVFTAATLIVVTIPAVLGLLSWRQVQAWKDSITLWTHTLGIDPTCAIAHNNLANALRDQGKITDAIEHYQLALRFQPNRFEANNSLAYLFAEQGMTNEAIEHYEQSLRTNPAQAKAHSNLGVAFANQGNFEKAIEHYQHALRVEPYLAKTLNNLGVALMNQGKREDAVIYFQRALEIEPNSEVVRKNLDAAKGNVNERKLGRPQ